MRVSFHLLDDVRQALRTLRSKPGFAAAAILTLALGIGATTTLLSVVDTLMLRPPAGVRQPAQVVRPYFHFESSFGGWTGGEVSYPDFTDLRDHVPAFAEVAAYYRASMSFGRGSEARPAAIYGVSGDYFRLLGARAAKGRLLEAADDSLARPVHAAVVNHRYWRSALGGDPAILGREVVLGSERYVVVGVAEPGFGGADLTGPDFWIPLSAAAGSFAGPEFFRERGFFFLRMVARLRPGISWEAATDQATAAVSAGRADTTVRNGFQNVLLGPIQEARGPEAGNDVSVSLWLAAVSVLVLLVACANVANLLLQRGLSRDRELAIRRVMGASDGRLVQHLLVESMVIAVLGGAVAAVLALWGGEAIRAFLLPAGAEATFALDGRLLAVILAISILSGVMAGVMPAWRNAKGDLTPALKQGSLGAGYRRSHLRDGLVAAQVALTVVLVVGAGLFVQSLRNALNLDIGLDPSQVVMLSADLAAEGYRAPEVLQAFTSMKRAVSHHPATEHTSISMGAPFEWAMGMSVRLPGQDSVARLPTGGPYYQAVEPEYRETVGLALLLGRDFTPADRDAPVIQINSRAAHLLWPGRNALGQCLLLGEDPRCHLVIGIVEDGRLNAVMESSQPMLYTPLGEAREGRIHLTLFVRTRTDARAAAASLRDLAQQAYPGLPFVRAQAMQDVIAPQYDAWRMGATMFGAFGALGLVLATIGVYSTLAYAVRARTRELGIRLALGASGPSVVRLVVRDGLRVIAIGLGAGTAAALLGGRALTALLYGVSPSDPVVLLATLGLLTAATVCACVLPARRATRLNPMTVLQSE